MLLGQPTICSRRGTLEFAEISQFLELPHMHGSASTWAVSLVSAGKSTAKIARLVVKLVTSLEAVHMQTLNADMIYSGTPHCVTKKKKYKPHQWTISLW